MENLKNRMYHLGGTIQNCPFTFGGKTLVFAMTEKLIPDFWRNQEISEKFWKIYEQVKLDLFQNFYLFLIIFLIPNYV